LQVSSNITDWLGAGADGLLDFDGVDDYVSFSPAPDVTGTKTINFKLYIKSSHTLTSDREVIMIIHNDNNNQIYLRNWLDISDGTEYLEINVDVGLSGKRYEIANFGKDVVLECELIKTTGVISSFTVNGVAQTSSVNAGAVTINETNIGYDGSNYGTGFYIWDVEIVESNFNAPGYPSGNLASAWTNGIYTATVNGSPTTANIGNGVPTNWNQKSPSASTVEVITGSGFFKNAFSMQKDLSVGFHSYSDLFEINTGDTFILSFRYKTVSVTGPNAYVVIRTQEGGGTDYLLESIPENSGDAVIHQTSQFTPGITPILIEFYPDISGSTGGKIIVDELEILKI
jgi:hypothetical protein